MTREGSDEGLTTSDQPLHPLEREEEAAVLSHVGDLDSRILLAKHQMAEPDPQRSELDGFSVRPGPGIVVAAGASHAWHRPLLDWSSGTFQRTCHCALTSEQWTSCLMPHSRCMLMLDVDRFQGMCNGALAADGDC